MKKATRFVGLDVHAETIAIAVAEPGRGGEVRSLGTIPNRPEAVRKLVSKLGGAKSIQACYEAGPTGYTLYWLSPPASAGTRSTGVTGTQGPTRWRADGSSP
jgi:transposase